MAFFFLNQERQQPFFPLIPPDLESPRRPLRSSAEGESGKRAGPGP